MQPHFVTQTGVGASDWQSIDTFIAPVQVGIAVTITGNPVYTVEHSYDPDAGPDSLAWPHSTLVNQTAPGEGSYTTPIACIRINMTDGTGSVLMSYIQAGVS